MVLNNKIHEISKDVDHMLLTMQKETNEENEKGNNQQGIKRSC